MAVHPALMNSVRDALEQLWILDIDASIRPMYGREEGAEIGYNIGYNPHTPGARAMAAYLLELGETTSQTRQEPLSMACQVSA